MSTFVTTKTKGFLNKSFIQVLAIVFITFLIYSNTFNAPFVFDDIASIVKNDSIHDPSNYLPPTASRDIGHLTFSVNYRLNGLDVFGYHAINLLMHILNAVLVYFLVSLTLSTPFFKPCSNSLSQQNKVYIMAFFASALFAVHPLQTESVTYIVQRHTSLVTFFYLLSFVTYIKWRLGIEQQAEDSEVTDRGPQENYCSTAPLLYCSSFIFAALAMKTKEIAFTLPICISVYEFFFFRGKPVKRALYLIPLLLTMLIIPITLFTPTGSHHSLNKSFGDIIGNVSEVTRDHPDIPRLSYLFTQFNVIVTYLRLLFLPINQNLDYDYPVSHSLLEPAVFLSFMLLLLVFSLGVYLYRISRITHYALRITAFGIFWFFITLSVESSVIPIRDVIFEHRVYLPSVGFFMALTGAIAAGLSIWGKRATYVKKTLLYIMLAVMLVLSGATYARNAVWKNSIRLWRNTVEGSPDKARPHISLGVAYYHQGRTDEAISEYKIALKLKPDYTDAHNNLGLIYLDQGRIDEAINEYQIAFRLDPDYAGTHYNLGIAYFKQGRHNEAIDEFKTSVKLKPDYVDAHYNLGLAYAKQGLIDEAIDEFKTSVKLKPDYVDAYNNLGVAYGTQGRTDEAINEFKTALRLNPDHNNARQNLELLLKK